MNEASASGGPGGFLPDEALRAVLNAVAEPIFVKDEEHRWVYVNDAYCRFVGYEREALLGRTDTDVFPEAQARLFWARDADVLATGRENVYGETVPDRRGSPHEVVVRKTLSVAGGRRWVVGVIHDVMEQRRAERVRAALYAIAETASAAEDMPAFYAAVHRIVGTLMNAGNFIIALHDEARGRITFPYFADERDQNPGEIPFGRGLTAHVITAGTELHATQTDWGALEQRFGIVPIGTPPIDWLGVPLKTRGPAFGALVVQSYDPARRFTNAEFELLTFVSRHIAAALERRRGEEAFRAMAHQYRLLFDKNPHPMWVYDLETLRFLAVNDAAIRDYGYTKDELLQMTIDGIRPDGDVPRLLRSIEGVAPDALDAAGPWRHRRKDGTVFDAEVTSQALRFEERAAELVMAIDVTERRSLEEQLRQSQKMDAVGKLAGGIAHDFNNLLTTVLGYTDILLTSVPVESATREALVEIKSAGERAAALTRRLLAFSRKQVLEPRVLDLNSVIAESGNLLRRLIGEDVELVLDVDSGIGPVRADPGQIEQILMNLVLNARDAMPGGGKVVIETREVQLEGADRKDRLYVVPGRYVRLKVTDTGVGMDTETLRHVFEPFFTTKPKGKGTGLGLAVVYGIVKQSGGYVWTESAPEQGASFEVHLPVVDTPAEDAPLPVDEGHTPTGGGETILLAEDDEKIRTLMDRVLRSAGYQVLAAADGEAALRIASAFPMRIHLVLTDVVMPRLNGRELVGRLAPTHPRLRVLYTSGYTDDALSARDIVDAGAKLLRKPFTPAELLARVRDVLGTPRVARTA